MRTYGRCLVFLALVLGVVVFPCQAMEVGSVDIESGGSNAGQKRGASLNDLARDSGASKKTKRAARRVPKKEAVPRLKELVAKSNGEMPEISSEFERDLMANNVLTSTKLEKLLNYNDDLDKAIEEHLSTVPEDQKIALSSLNYAEYEEVRTIIYDMIMDSIRASATRTARKERNPNMKHHFLGQYEGGDDFDGERLRRLRERWEKQNEYYLASPNDQPPLQMNIQLSRIGISRPPMMPRPDVGKKVMDEYDSRWKKVVDEVGKKQEIWRGNPNGPFPEKVWGELNKKLMSRYFQWIALRENHGDSETSQQLGKAPYIQEEQPELTLSDSES